MKISIDVDCTPEEARTFLGLPDVKPVQEALMKDIEERMRSGVAAMDPEALVKMWMPGGGMQGWESLQKSFWAQMMGKAAGNADTED